MTVSRPLKDLIDQIMSNHKKPEDLLGENGISYPPIMQSWQRNWARIIPFFDYPPEIRRIIYTTNAIDSVNMNLREITKNRGAFTSGESLIKLFYPVLMNIRK